MRRLQTFWKVFNIIGGLRIPSMVELWGPPSSGKTLFSYDFVRRNNDEKTVIVIVDNELSTDEERLSFAFGLKKANYIKLNDKEVLVDGGSIEPVDGSIDGDKDGDYILCPYPYIELTFENLREMCEKLSDDRRLFIIYDSVSTQVTKAALSSKEEMFAGGRQEAPRVLKFFSAKLLSSMYNRNVIVFFINHVYSGMFGKLMAGGGFSFHHNMHTSLFFKKESDMTLPENPNLVVMSRSSVSVTKNKFGPLLSNGSLIISTRDGGVVMESESTCADMLNYGVIKNNGKGWYSVPGLIDGNKRYDAIVNMYKSDSEIRSKMDSLLEKKIFDIYPLSKVISESSEKEEDIGGA